MRLAPCCPAASARNGTSVANQDADARTKIIPKKHGPFFQLSYSVGGRSSSKFLKKDEFAVVKKCLQRYKRFKELGNELIATYVEEARRVGIAALIAEEDS